MNKTAIKNYAIWARAQLIESAKQRAFEYAITDGENDPKIEIINGRILSSEEKNQRVELISMIKQKGFEQVMEEAAYTWFNRFIALRFMEVNGYLPTKVRVFTDENGEFKPQILKEAMTVELDGIDRNKILGLIEKQDNEELFKYLIIAQCNALSSGLPGMFETISNWTELMFPANLLKADSVIGQMIANISEEDWTDQVQIIGWLYQAYYSEPKDYRINAHKQYDKTDIPYVTQLFTPDWIVRYMVENSLGRLWYEGHQDFDKSEWKYYLDEAEQEPEVEEELKKIREEYAQIKPEEIKIIDPCMGSGHILVYAFDVLMQIYSYAGWSERDASKSILENNLFGLDIDDRAGQLAYFAVMMKARKYNRRILNGEVRPKVLSIQESNGIDINLEKLGPEKVIAQKLIKELKDAKEYGSILNLSVKQEDLESLRKRLVDIDEMSGYGSLIVQMESDQIINSLYPLIELAEIMIQKYDVVVTNPPYMGAALMPNSLKCLIRKDYANYKNDLFAAFIVKAICWVKDEGYISMLTPYVWMFISAYEKLRSFINKNTNISSLIQLEYNAFEAACVPVGCYTLKKTKLRECGEYIRLSDFKGADNQEPKVLEAVKNRKCGYRFSSSQEYFQKIPGSPIAYWASKKFFDIFTNVNTISKVCAQKTRISTGDNERFMRLWFEGDFHKTIYPNKWVLCPKGGDYRKWYGNIVFVLNWGNSGEDLKSFSRAMLGDANYFFKSGLTWTVISSSKTGFRIVPEGTICDHKGPLIYVFEETNKPYLMGLLNSKYSEKLLEITAPTIGFEWGAIAKTPWLLDEQHKGEITNLVNKNVNLSKEDWDSFEISYDYKRNPLI